ncbi:MAG: sulfoquinovosidase [Solirubrobacteraceae bacterium]|jgi:alpha-glucosidase (family GH31 glycosyl hydrolase)|nr:sulfoquinovosidase [Solirubrobacteraceae bacterium]
MRRGLVAVAFATGWAAAPAHGAALINDAGVTVIGRGASAVVTRDPVGIAFRGARGTTVLREFASASPDPFAVLPVPGPVPLGLDVPPSPALYAPLTFTVGSGVRIQAPAAQFVGNILTGVETGLTYQATAVTRAEPAGRGARLTLATNDPSGRTLGLTVTPGRPGTIRVSVRPSDPTGISAMGDAFASPAGEAFRGFGGRHNAIDQHGEDFINWTQQENVGAGLAAPASTDDRLLFPNGRTAAYYVQSQFVSNAGYAFLLDRDELSRWRMDSDREDAWQVQASAAGLDYLVVTGGPRLAIGRMTAITGRHRPPPRWALGGLWDREVKYPGDNATDYLAAVMKDLADFKRYRTPISGYRIEGWEFLSREQLRTVIANLRRRHIHPLLYFRAFVGQDTIGTDSPTRYDEALAGGYVATHADGTPYTFLSNFQAQGALIDFTNPAAVRWWQGRIREALRLGADGFMQDFGEQTLEDMHFHDGSTGLTMHNRYAKLYHGATRAVLDRWNRRHHTNVWFFTRTGYSGTPGSAAYEGANFAGDGTTDFSASSGLASQAPDMLNRAIGGAYGFTTDIGGYFDVGPFVATTKELFDRWSAWAALSPYFRLHGSVLNGTHTPWSYDQETVDHYNAFTRLHLAARPLILRLMRRAARTGIPPTRPLWLTTPGDARARAEDQEWQLGGDVLVAPVVTEGATGRDVVFPRGCWRAPGRRSARVRGPAVRRVDARLGRLPFFFRCGHRPFTPPAGVAAPL